MVFGQSAGAMDDHKAAQRTLKRRVFEMKCDIAIEVKSTEPEEPGLLQFMITKVISASKGQTLGEGLDIRGGYEGGTETGRSRPCESGG